jgi:hypothetical protein
MVVVVVVVVVIHTDKASNCRALNSGNAALDAVS